jgi:hypothetical protein
MTSRNDRYGVVHKTLRKRVALSVTAGRAVCWRCEKPIHPDEEWHLGHTDDWRSWAGPEHATCNLRAGGQARARQLYGPREPGPAGYEPRDRVARERWRTWWAEHRGEGPEAWSRHWVGDTYDGRCPRCRELGAACEEAER